MTKSFRCALLLTSCFIPWCLTSFAAESADPGSTSQLPPEIFGQPPSQAAQMCQKYCACPAPDGKLTATAVPAADGAPNPHTSPSNPHGASPHAAGAPPYGGPANPHGRYHKGAMGRGFPTYSDIEEVINYPIPFVDRPLTLPEGLTQPEIIGQILGDTSRPGSEIYERLSFAVQNGITDRWQVGATVNMRVDPRISLGSAYAIVQYAANPYMNGRLELGVRRATCGVEGNAFSGGFGLPIKYRLTPWLAAISGRPQTYAFGENILTWDVKGCGTTATFGIPLGLLATVADNFNFGLRTGYRRLFGSDASANFIPLAFDFAIMVGRQADVGLTLELPNPLETPSDWDRQQPLVYERKLFIFGQTRF